MKQFFKFIEKSTENFKNKIVEAIDIKNYKVTHSENDSFIIENILLSTDDIKLDQKNDLFFLLEALNLKKTDKKYFQHKIKK